MAAASIVFPPPPPTSNSLSHRQKAQLMRSTKKLGQVLGYTPHFLDRGHSIVQSPCFEDWSEDEEDWYRPASRGSTRTATSTGTGYSSGGSTSTLSSRHTRSSSSSHSTRFTKSSKSSYTNDSWSSNDAKPPLLRLALSLPYRSSQPNSPTSSNTSDEEDGRFTLAPLADERNPRDSLVSPTFRIPTATTVRLQKMDRIRRKLGDGVPVELVFPDADVEVNSKPKRSHSVTTTVIEISATTLPPLPPHPPVPRPTKTRNAARDSIHSSSAHRAQRVKRKPVPKLEPSRPAPPPPTVAPRNGDRLSLILEEQGASFVTVSATPPSRRRAEPASPVSQWYSEEEQWVDYNTLLKLSEHSP